MTPLRYLMGRTFAVLLLPLSLVPIYLALPRLKAEFGSTAQAADRHALTPPTVKLTSDETKSWRPLPVNRNAIPVITYHGINDHNDVYSVSRRTFAAQMEMLYRAGFHTISIEQYVRFLHGDKHGLPRRPILITFDDGRLDSYRGADLVLARFDFRATMFVIVDHAMKKEPFYLQWGEMRAMERSGRWDIQEHAGAGHYNVPYAPGKFGPYYAYRRYSKQHGRESFGSFAQRVRQDLLWGKRMLAKNLPGPRQLAFAVPFGNFGQQDTNDSRIPHFMSRFLGSHFEAVFLVKPSAYTTPRTRSEQIGRYEVHTYTTAGKLYYWLRDKLPALSGAFRVPPLWCHPGWTCLPSDPQLAADAKRSARAAAGSSAQTAAPSSTVQTAPATIYSTGGASGTSGGSAR